MLIGDLQVDAVIDGECLSAKETLYVGERLPSDEEWETSPNAFDSASGKVLMSVGGYLIRSGNRLVLQDAGLGPRTLGSFRVGGLRSSLLAIGVQLDEITDVVYSHLHVDHVGWTTVDGVPMFPNAELWVDRREWEYHAAGSSSSVAAWETDMARDAFGGMARLFEPVRDRIRLFEPGFEFVPGVRALDAAGHSPGNTVFELSSAGQVGLLLGDLVHTVGELLHDWELGFHHDAGAALEAIRRFRARLVRSGEPFAAAHFPGLPWGRLDSDADGGVRYLPLLDRPAR